MTLKMDSRDDRIGRSVSLGEMLGHPGVMPPTDASQRGWIREERGDDGFDISRFHDRLTSGARSCHGNIGVRGPAGIEDWYAC